MKCRLSFSILLASLAFFAIHPSDATSQPYGIDIRTPNTSLLITELPADMPGTMQKVRVFPQLTFTRPVLLIESPDTSNRLFVVQQNGLIRCFVKTPDPAPGDVSTFLDISGRVLNSGEQGLLGLAFDPDYATNGVFYVYYSWNGTNPGTSRVSRFTNDNPADNSVDPATEEIILAVAQPYTNHNGGMIAFGPDQYLYIGLGDGGSGGDPLNSGQNTTTLLGSILRIDVRSTPDPGLDYKIPPDNPFYVIGPAGTSTRKEIYAYGLRNPWRFSFDMQNDYLLAGDVGQNAYEEIDAIESGNNYGWRIMEGSHCYNAATCDQTGLTLPLVDYPRTDGNSVTGGYVYYGADVPDLYGVYIYGDFGSGRIWGLKYDGSAVLGPYVLISSSGLNISGFGQDDSGEVYVLNYYGGEVHVLRPVTTPPGSTFPTRLSDIPALWRAGKGIDQTTSGIIPYEPSAKLWSDGALKERFLALPNLQQIGYREAGGWDFSENALLIKNFIVPLDERDPVGTAKRLETRLLYWKSGQLHGFSFEWDDAETDAQLLTTSKIKPLTILDENGDPVEISYLYPSRTQCAQCHTVAANGALGLTTPQMNFDFTYPDSGVTDNQLRTYDHISLFTASLPGPPETLPRMPDPMDPNDGTLEERALAYLASNCSMCHQPGGTAPTGMDLRWETPLTEKQIVDVVPGNGNLGITDARIVSTQDVDKSILLVRMELRDGLYQMPPLATSRVDAEAVALIREWIQSLQTTSAVSGWIYW